ncbi:cysteine dioxygenase [Nesidiocoris tenuis]|uniref:Cysteine dioxygenase n=1 Tax=Nesidiocoris tenuis TaxID=355587 RepID=A0ABN7AZ22_9HEMI|nr:cysteine dioxygenase [Nesidiocoris tenuis]
MSNSATLAQDPHQVEFEPTSLKDVIAQLRILFDSDRVNIEEVGDLLKSYKSDPKDWRRFAKFDRFRYTRNLIDEGNGKYNLMLLCWGEGHGSAIHDHADSHCFMKVLQGTLSEVRFSWPAESSSEGEGGGGDETEDLQPMTELSRNQLPLNAVCYINDSLGLHRVENPSYSDTAVSLHLYCPPFEECSVFNQRTGHRSKAKVTFWSRYGQKPVIQEERLPEDN